MPAGIAHPLWLVLFSKENSTQWGSRTTIVGIVSMGLLADGGGHTSPKPELFCQLACGRQVESPTQGVLRKGWERSWNKWFLPGVAGWNPDGSPKREVHSLLEWPSQKGSLASQEPIWSLIAYLLSGAWTTDNWNVDRPFLGEVANAANCDSEIAQVVKRTFHAAPAWSVVAE